MFGMIQEIVRPDPHKRLEHLEREQADLLTQQAEKWRRIGAAEADGADTASLRDELRHASMTGWWVSKPA